MDMKRFFSFIIMEISLCSAWSQSLEQKIRKVLLENTFTASGIYDFNTYSFSEENGKLLWKEECSNEYGSYTLGGETEINGKKILIYYKWCSEGAEWYYGGDKSAVGWKGARELEIEGIEPDIGFEDCRYKLAGVYKGGEVKVGDKILIGKLEAVKADKILAVNALCNTYASPDENDPLIVRSIIYNRVAGESYIDINCARILPGAMVPVRAEIPNSKNTRGEKGTWYYGAVFGESNYWKSNAWFFVPDTVEVKVRKDFGQFDDYEGPYHVLDFKDSFAKEARRLGLSHTTQKQKESLYTGTPMREPYDALISTLPALINRTKLEVGKSYVLEDNLKMRSEPNLSAEKLTTAVKGSKAKVVKCGRYDIIDNIYSRWVQVEFESSAKDKDGKVFDEKKAYWCFGGYLE